MKPKVDFKSVTFAVCLLLGSAALTVATNGMPGSMPGKSVALTVATNGMPGSMPGKSAALTVATNGMPGSMPGKHQFACCWDQQP